MLFVVEWQARGIQQQEEIIASFDRTSHSFNTKAVNQYVLGMLLLKVDLTPKHGG